MSNRILGGRDSWARRSWWAAIAGLVAAVLGIGLVAGCTPSSVTQDQAVRDATVWFAGAHGSGARVENIKILAIERGLGQRGEDVWKVNIGGDVVAAGDLSPGYSSYMWLDIDASSGMVTVVAQG
jgi:hypothetical protein